MMMFNGGALLRATGGLNAYGQIYGYIAPANVGEFLLFDRGFPRSVLFSLGAALDSQLALKGHHGAAHHDQKAP
jgi:uncharacterized alpha-E superfamily protein